MKNEYGAVLDSNGYAESIIQSGNQCALCGRGGELARHEIFHGPYRAKSKSLGLWVLLCPDCHSEVHAQKGGKDRYLKQLGQKGAREYYGWSVDDFRQRFGKNHE